MVGWVRGLAAVLAAAGLASGAGTAFAERATDNGVRAPAAFETSFRILRNGTPIGVHRYTFTLSEGGLTVSSTATATVTLLGLPVYRFTQQVREVWQEGRLVALDAHTDDNGDRTHVSARATARGLTVDGPLGRAIAAPSAVPTTYWNIGTVRGAQLIDTRDGEVMTRPVTPLAWERIAEPDGTATPAQRYRIAGRSPCDVWYDAEGVWQRVACDTEHGRLEDVRMHASGNHDQLARMLLAHHGGDARVAQRQPEQ